MHVFGDEIHLTFCGQGTGVAFSGVVPQRPAACRERPRKAFTQVIEPLIFRVQHSRLEQKLCEVGTMALPRRI